MNLSRRKFIKTLAQGSLGAAGFLTGSRGLFQLDAMAENNSSLASSDYKALVCIFLYGGNDSNNMIIPLDSGKYDAYTAARGILAINKAKLLPMAPSNLGEQYGLHPALSAIHPIWENGRMAVLTNVGTLVQPFANRDAYLNRQVVIPDQLFSHLDQTREWESGNSWKAMPNGWGGRISALTRNMESNVLAGSISISGASLFSTGTGAASSPLVLQPAPTSLSSMLRLKHPSYMLGALLDAENKANSPDLTKAAAKIMQRAITASETLVDDPQLATTFPNTSLGNQLLQVSKLIKLAQYQGIRRQIFFCSLSGFDTHVGQGLDTGIHANLLKNVGDALAAFDLAMTELDLNDQVTSFTMSEFNRTLKPNGSGSDHAWGGHHLILGGAVKGGQFYGDFPDLVLAGPSDSDNGANARGRWIPTTAVDQYAATLATWYGVDSKDLQAVFPNLKNFPTTNLGFMNQA